MFLGTSNLAPDSRRSVLTSLLLAVLARPATHIAFGLLILLLDCWTGPFLAFSVVFVLPVVLSAWFCGARLAYGLAVFLSVGRTLIAVFLDPPTSLHVLAVEGLTHITVLSLLAFLVARTVRQEKELKVLRGLLPICMFCKRIRDEHGGWQRLEVYIAEHSEAAFTHGLCPDCAEDRYGDVLDRERNADSARRED